MKLEIGKKYKLKTLEQLKQTVKNSNGELLYSDNYDGYYDKDMHTSVILPMYKYLGKEVVAEAVHCKYNCFCYNTWWFPEWAIIKESPLMEIE